jgi:predicted nucleotidyltransferase
VTTCHYAAGEEPDQPSIRLALSELVDALHSIEVRALFMGGIATLAQSRPRPTDDLDLFVHPEDAEELLDHLAACGFETEKTDARWLYKAFRHGVLVDIVFRSSGDIYLDDEMLEHATELEVKGEKLRLVSPEDLAVIKAIATAEHSAHHWYDALAIIARHDLDWEYLLERARRHGPRRVLSLLLYAESNDLPVPADAVERLHAVVHTP